MNRNLPSNLISFETSDWQSDLKTSITSLESLAEEGFISPSSAVALQEVARRFQIRVTRYYAGLINPQAGLEDPILKQAIPNESELDRELPSEIKKLSQEIFGRENPWLDDAIGDVEKMAAPRLTHRYGNRAIMHLSSMCALYCRFCFRKTHLNDEERSLYEGTLDAAFEYLNTHPEISELILTGGDPLSVTDLVLEKILKRLALIPHLRVVRIHSRMPVTLPSRLTEKLALILRTTMDTSNLQISIVAHFNHPNEITPYAIDRLRMFKRHGVTFYNQSVLLRGVNDDAEVLAKLFQSLYEIGVTPFYLHHADLTKGTFHFRASIARGREIMRSLQGLVSGPALPRYVLDLPGGDGKIDLMDSDNVTLSNEVISGGVRAASYQISSPSRTRTENRAKIRYLDIHTQ